MLPGYGPEKSTKKIQSVDPVSIDLDDPQLESKDQNKAKKIDLDLPIVGQIRQRNPDQEAETRKEPRKKPKLI